MQFLGGKELGKMFEVYFADMCANKFLLVLMGERADLSSVRRQGASTPISTSRRFFQLVSNSCFGIGIVGSAFLSATLNGSQPEIVVLMALKLSFCPYGWHGDNTNNNMNYIKI